ncbi:MAG: hypothetical protein A2Y62_11170 [Candidatus Fischerbacteria bacterium RBG_13_37_8]|uniref:histidine kinase n=1 Tax=Candidatus Fischerbacteria bacterium RBG_13_37_8 TaxID=1817863 RepID=A0A1F5VX74_9BACT|nr:MAG: hypothetical protein A2Y62_11170 [Candidatus Fischerbacteria bacterium RBG_13_37_8]
MIKKKKDSMPSPEGSTKKHAKASGKSQRESCKELKQRNAELIASTETLRKKIIKQDMIEKELRQSEIVLEINGSMVNYKGQKAILSINHDITQRKCTEEALRESEEKYRLLVESSLQGICIAQGIPPLLVFVNPAFAEMLGYTVDELLSLSHEETQRLIHPEDRAIFFQRYRERLEGKSTILRHEIRAVRKDGSVRMIELIGSPIKYKGQPAVQAVFQDISERKMAEEQILIANERLKYLLTSTPAVIYTAKISGDYGATYATENIVLLTGYNSKEFTKESNFWKEHIHPEDVQRILGELPDIFERGYHAYDYRFLHKNGGYIWIRDEMRLIKDKEGNPLEIVGYMTDLTEQKKSEILQRKDEQRARALLSLFQNTFDSTEAIISFAMEVAMKIAESELCFIGFIDELESIMFTHLWSEKAMKKCAIDYKPVQFSISEAGLWGETVRQRKVIVVNNYSAPNPFKKGIPTGHVKIKRFLGIPVLHDGRVVMVCGLANKKKDYDEFDKLQIVLFMQGLWEMICNRRSKEEIEKKKAEFEAIFNSIYDGVFFIDAQHHIQMINPAVTRMFGYTFEELRGKTTEILYPKKLEYDAKQEILKECRRTFDSQLFEMVCQRKDGTEFCSELITTPIIDSQGDSLGFISIHRDITERKQLEAQLLQSQKLEAVGQLAGGVAHDFNNLLTVIMGYGELLFKQLQSSDPLRDYAKSVLNSARRGADFTNQLLALSSRHATHKEVLNLNTVVADTDNILNRLISEHIEMMTILDPTLKQVNANPTQIVQVLMNLAVNARDAMPHGGLLTICTANVSLDEAYSRRHPGATPGPYVMISVSDTGHGMDANVQAHIFEPFFTTKEKGKGTGLGLSAVYGIVKQSGGHIEVESAPGKGSTFKIYFPCAEGILEVPRPPPDLTDLPRGTETILVVEDEEAVRSFICKVLRSMGYRILEGCNGVEALKISKKYHDPIHLLLTDVIMPRLSGSELAKLLLAQRPELKILLISGYTDGEIGSYSDITADMPLLQKPFSTAILARLVRKILDADGVGPQH